MQASDQLGEHLDDADQQGARPTRGELVHDSTRLEDGHDRRAFVGAAAGDGEEV
jgi:hypothetical protein